jgi:hypothetical protein
VPPATVAVTTASAAVAGRGRGGLRSEITEDLAGLGVEGVLEADLGGVARGLATPGRPLGLGRSLAA